MDRKKPIYEKIDIVEKRLWEIFRKNEFVSDISIEIEDIVSDFDFLINFFNTINVKKNIYELKKEIETELPFISVKLLDEQIETNIEDAINDSELEINEIDFYCTIVLKNENKELENVWK